MGTAIIAAIGIGYFVEAATLAVLFSILTAAVYNVEQAVKP